MRVNSLSSNLPEDHSLDQGEGDNNRLSGSDLRFQSTYVLPIVRASMPNLPPENPPPFLPFVSRFRSPSMSSSYSEDQGARTQQNFPPLSTSVVERPIENVNDAASQVFSFNSNDLRGKRSKHTDKEDKNTDNNKPYDPVANQRFLIQLYNNLRQDKQANLLEKFNRDLDNLNAKINANNKRIRDTKEYKNNFDQLVKIVDSNIEFFLGFFRTFITENEGDHDTFSFYLDVKKSLIKSISATFILVKNLWPLYHIRDCQKDLKNIKEKYAKCLEPFKESLDLVESEKQITADYEKCKDNIKQALAETIIYVIVPFLAISLLSSNLDLDDKKITRPFKLIFKISKRISKIKNCFRNFKSQYSWYQDLQLPEIKTHLGEVSIKQMQNNEYLSIKALLEKQKVEFESKLAIITLTADLLEANLPSKLESLEEFLAEADRENFDAFLKEFHQKGFLVEDEADLKDKWILDSFSPSYKKAICAQSIRGDLLRHQLTMAQLLKQGAQVAISKKLDVESNLLIFNSLKLALESLYTLAQILLVIPYLGKLLAEHGGAALLSTLENNLPITGIHFLYFLNPDLDLSVFGFALKGISHFWNSYYKPNEYSWKGYWNDSKTKWACIQYNFLYLVLYLKKWSFKLMDKIIELVLNKTKPSSDSYKELNAELKKNREEYKSRLRYLKEELNTLKKLDIQQTLNPHLSDYINGYKDLRAYLIENNCPKPLLKQMDNELKLQNNLSAATTTEIDKFLESNCLYSRDQIVGDKNEVRKIEMKYHLDHLQVMVETLESVNFEAFPEDVLNFFEKNANFNHDSETPIQKQIEKLFTTTDKKFFNQHKKKLVSV